MSQPQTHTSLPLASPASASSSTLITTPLPIGRSKESLRLPSSLPPSSASLVVPDSEGIVPPPTARPRLPININALGVGMGPGTGMGTAPPPTRMSASGFVEPHHSNVPRRVRTRTRTRTRTKSGPSHSRSNSDASGGSDAEDNGEDNEFMKKEREEKKERKVKQLRRSVKEALTPGRRWSDSEDDSPRPEQQRALPVAEDASATTTTELPNANPPATIPTTSSLPTSQTSYLYPGAVPSSDSNLSSSDPNNQNATLTPARPTPTSSRNLNTSRTPLHLLSLKLPPTPGPGSPTEPIVGNGVTTAPIQGGVNGGVSGGVGLPVTNDAVQTAPAFPGSFPVPVGVAQPKTPQVAQTSTLRPATLPRRRKPTAGAAGTPAAKTAPVPAASDSTSPSKAQNAPEMAETRDKAHISTPPPPQAQRDVATRDAATPTPGPTPGPSRTPGVGVRFHGHHSGSSEASSSKLHSKLKSKVNGRDITERENGNVRLGRRNTVSVAKDGKDGCTTPRTGEGKRSRSLVDPRSATRTPTRARRGDRASGRNGSRARSTQRGEETSPSKSKARGKAGDLYDADGHAEEEQDADLDDGARARRAAARDERRRRRAEKEEKRRVEREAREERRKARREAEERMCVQRVGMRARVEVAFLVESGEGVGESVGDVKGNGEDGMYVLLRVVEPEEDTDLEDEDEDWWDSDTDVDADVPSTDATPATSNSETPVPPHATDPTAPTELKLYLPTDLSKHIDGLPALSTAQIREGCEFIHRILSSSSPPTAMTTASGAEMLANPLRVRVLAPRARPEDAWAVALCYQAGVESSVAAAASASSSQAKALPTTDAPILSSSTTASTSSSSGAARLIVSKSTYGSPAGQASRRLSVPVPVPPLALVRGEDGEVEGVVEVEVDVETIDDVVDVGGDVVVDVVGDLEETVAPLVAPVDPESPPDTNTDAVELDEDTFMLHPTYAYSSVHVLAMQLLDEGAGEWHGRGKQWEERVERMGFSVGGVGVKKAPEPVVDAADGDCDGDEEESEEDENGAEDDWDGEYEEGDSDREDDSYDDYAEEDDEELKSAGARQGSQSTGERGVNGIFADGGDDDSEYERGRTNEPHTRTGHHGVPMPSKYEEPSSAFVSSVNGRSKSRGARSKSKAAASQSKSRARSVSMSASGSKANGMGTRKSRLSTSYDPFLDNEDGDGEGVADKATRKARRAEARQARLLQRRAQKEAEEVQAYGGIRMEWRGVLSFDGLQKLVDVWAPT